MMLYAYLAGEIDHDAAQNLRIQLDDALLSRTPAHAWSLDLGGVGFMDSSGIGLILRAAALRPRYLGDEPAAPARPRSSCNESCGWQDIPCT